MSHRHPSYHRSRLPSEYDDDHHQGAMTSSINAASTSSLSASSSMADMSSSSGGASASSSSYSPMKYASGIGQIQQHRPKKKSNHHSTNDTPSYDHHSNHAYGPTSSSAYLPHHHSSHHSYNNHTPAALSPYTPSLYPPPFPVAPLFPTPAAPSSHPSSSPWPAAAPSAPVVPFAFAPRVRLAEWESLLSLDLGAIVRNVDIATLQRNMHSLVFADVREEDLHVFSGGATGAAAAGQQQSFDQHAHRYATSSASTRPLLAHVGISNSIHLFRLFQLLTESLLHVQGTLVASLRSRDGQVANAQSKLEEALETLERERRRARESEGKYERCKEELIDARRKMARDENQQHRDAPPHPHTYQPITYMPHPSSISPHAHPLPRTGPPSVYPGEVFQCALCANAFVSLAYLTQHYQRRHPGYGAKVTREEPTPSPTPAAPAPVIVLLPTPAPAPAAPTISEADVQNQLAALRREMTLAFESRFTSLSSASVSPAPSPSSSPPASAPAELLLLEQRVLLSRRLARLEQILQVEFGSGAIPAEMQPQQQRLYDTLANEIEEIRKNMVGNQADDLARAGVNWNISPTVLKKEPVVVTRTSIATSPMPSPMLAPVAAPAMIVPPPIPSKLATPVQVVVAAPAPPPVLALAPAPIVLIRPELARPASLTAPAAAAPVSSVSVIPSADIARLRSVILARLTKPHVPFSDHPSLVSRYAANEWQTPPPEAIANLAGLMDRLCVTTNRDVGGAIEARMKDAEGGEASYNDIKSSVDRIVEDDRARRSTLAQQHAEDAVADAQAAAHNRARIDQIVQDNARRQAAEDELKAIDVQRRASILQRESDAKRLAQMARDAATAASASTSIAPNDTFENAKSIGMFASSPASSTTTTTSPAKAPIASTLPPTPPRPNLLLARSSFSANDSVLSSVSSPSELKPYYPGSSLLTSSSSTPAQSPSNSRVEGIGIGVAPNNRSVLSIAYPSSKVTTISTTTTQPQSIDTTPLSSSLFGGRTIMRAVSADSVAADQSHSPILPSPLNNVLSQPDRIVKRGSINGDDEKYPVQTHVSLGPVAIPRTPADDEFESYISPRTVAPRTQPSVIVGGTPPKPAAPTATLIATTSVMPYSNSISYNASSSVAPVGKVDPTTSASAATTFMVPTLVSRSSSSDASSLGPAPQLTSRSISQPGAPSGLISSSVAPTLEPLREHEAGGHVFLHGAVAAESKDVLQPVKFAAASNVSNSSNEHDALDESDEYPMSSEAAEFAYQARQDAKDAAKLAARRASAEAAILENASLAATAAAAKNQIVAKPIVTQSMTVSKAPITTNAAASLVLPSSAPVLLTNTSSSRSSHLGASRATFASTHHSDDNDDDNDGLDEIISLDDIDNHAASHTVPSSALSSRRNVAVVFPPPSSVHDRPPPISTSTVVAAPLKSPLFSPFSASSIQPGSAHINASSSHLPTSSTRLATSHSDVSHSSASPLNVYSASPLNNQYGASNNHHDQQPTFLSEFPDENEDEEPYVPYVPRVNVTSIPTSSYGSSSPIVSPSPLNPSSSESLYPSAASTPAVVISSPTSGGSNNDDLGWVDSLASSNNNVNANSNKPNDKGIKPIATGAVKNATQQLISSGFSPVAMSPTSATPTLTELKQMRQVRLLSDEEAVVADTTESVTTPTSIIGTTGTVSKKAPFPARRNRTLQSFVMTKSR